MKRGRSAIEEAFILSELNFVRYNGPAGVRARAKPTATDPLFCPQSLRALVLSDRLWVRVGDDGSLQNTV